MNQRRLLCILIIAIVAFIWGGSFLNQLVSLSNGYIPENGAVPSEITAIKIAEAVWLPIYGDQIYTMQPFLAEFDEKLGFWYVHGSLPENTFGGVPEIKINKSDGTIIYISHGK